MSNKKLTTEEKIEKSKKYSVEIKSMEKRLKEKRDAQKKLDSEIADELEKAYIVNMQTLGRHTAGNIGEGFSLEEYIDIVDCIFTLDEVTDYVKAEREKLRNKVKDDKSADTDSEDEVSESDRDSVSA